MREFVEMMMGALDERIKEETLRMTSGKCATLEAYRASAARIAAFEETKVMLKATLKKFNNDEETD